MKITGTPTADFVVKLQSQDVSHTHGFTLSSLNAKSVSNAHTQKKKRKKSSFLTGQKLHQKSAKGAKERPALYFLQS